MSDFVFLGASKPKARKDYTCDWCETTILKGEVHEKWVNVYDGGIDNQRVHIICLDPLSDSADPLEGFFCPENHGRGQTCEVSGHA